RPREDLEKMSVRVLEIEAAPAVAPIDLAGTVLRRIGPILQSALPNASESGIEFPFADQESVVLHRDVALSLVKIERHAIAEIDDAERPETARFRKTE